VTALADLPAGHTFPEIRFTIDAERSRAYLTATGDTLALYDEQNAVPPLAVAALALGALMEVIDLPDGTLHGNESMEAHAVVPVGATLECAPAVTRNATRGGMVFVTLEFVVTLEGSPVVTSRAAVLFPEAAK
jgi:MaoC dehydratase-like protein